MIVSTQRRLAALAGPALVAALALSACGGDESSAASVPTITLDAGETSYQTLPPETTSTTIAGDTVEVGAESEYTVQSGDYGLKVANTFGVSLDDLEAINGWADASKEFPNPGAVIKIPAGGTVAQTPSSEPASGATETPPGGSVGESAGGTGDTIPAVGDGCEAGSHVVKSGDIPLKLVKLYDVTLEALAQANADNPAYKTFIPGEKIIIPPKASC